MNKTKTKLDQLLKDWQIKKEKHERLMFVLLFLETNQKEIWK